MILDGGSRIHNTGSSSISSAGVTEMGCAWFGLRLDMGSMVYIAGVVASLFSNDSAHCALYQYLSLCCTMVFNAAIRCLAAGLE